MSEEGSSAAKKDEPIVHASASAAAAATTDAAAASTPKQSNSTFVRAYNRPGRKQIDLRNLQSLSAFHTKFAKGQAKGKAAAAAAAAPSLPAAGKQDAFSQFRDLDLPLAVVSGTSRGIGLALAQALVTQHQYRVLGISR